MLIEFKKKQPDFKMHSNLGRIKEEITISIMLNRQRLVSQSEGILNAKRIFELRSAISNIF